ncbi:unnamed protein product, partial [Brassica rapa subsp. trilocularis]
VFDFLEAYFQDHNELHPAGKLVKDLQKATGIKDSMF